MANGSDQPGSKPKLVKESDRADLGLKVKGEFLFSVLIIILNSKF